MVMVVGLISSTLGVGMLIRVAEGGSIMSARLLGMLFNSSSIFLVSQSVASLVHSLLFSVRL